MNTTIRGTNADRITYLPTIFNPYFMATRWRKKSVDTYFLYPQSWFTLEDYGQRVTF